MNVGLLAEDGIKRFGEYQSTYFEGRWYTNTEINLNANRFGNLLRKLGVNRGDRVAVQMPNCPPLLSSFSAINKIGAVIVPINPLLRPDQSAYIYQDSGAKVLLTSSDYLGWVLDAQKQSPELKHVIIVDRDDATGTLSYNKLMAGSPEQLTAEDMACDDLSALIYTAGTTGKPKGVMHTHYSFYINSLSFYENLLLRRPVTLRGYATINHPRNQQPVSQDVMVSGANRNNISLGVLPLSHSYGIAFMGLGSYVGGKSVIMRWWQPDEALKLIQNFRVTHIAAVPTMYIQMLESPAFGQYDLSSLTDCNSGGAALPVEVALKWREKVGVDIVEGWGLTESGATTTGQPEGAIRLGSIGKSLHKCVSIKIFDNNEQELPRGKTGEIVVSGPTVMKGYWKLPEDTAQAINNGWLHTGDVGYMDENGYIFITDRKKDIIIRGGENIAPGEVEQVLFKIPKVLEAAVVGIPDRVYGEEVKAFIVLKQGEKATPDEIVEFCKGQLPTFKIPKQIVFVDALPKNLLGKVLRVELRKLG